MTVAMIAVGCWDSTAWLVRDLASHCEVHLFMPERAAAYVRPELPGGVRLHPFRWPSYSRPLAQLRRARALVAGVHDAGFDVVHVQQGHYALSPFLGSLGPCPLVITAHEPGTGHGARHGPRRPPSGPIHAAFRRSDSVIVHADRLKAPLVRAGVRAEAIRTVARAAPPGPNGGGPAAEEGGPTVLLFGRLFPYKGLNDLIAAAPRVKRAVPDVTFVVAGRGDRLTRQRRLMRAAGCFRLEQRFVPREERDELFSEASVVVLPYVEGTTSAVLPLAQAHGKPVVVTDVGGLAEAVEHGRTGLVVPPRDPSALADAVVRLLADPPGAARLGEAGRRKLHVDSAPDRVARSTLAVYDLARAHAYT
jgi:glycosyltransferase involved in cell wall biosynthesis